MKKSSVQNLSLTPLDEIFKTNEEREDALREKVMEIPLSELYTFENHPFKVRDNDEMKEMAESIAKYGVVNPGIARPREDGGYELIVGHRRKRACELAGKETMPVTRYEKDGFGYYAVTLKESGKLIGQAGLFKTSFGSKKSVEIGYIFDKNFWEQGYCIEAAEACVEMAFGRLEADKLYCTIRPANAPNALLIGT